jgi:hypothetical protein
MSIRLRPYTSEPLFTGDYFKVREFFRDINRQALVYPGFTWGRWEWMTTHSMLDRSALCKIGLWEDNGKIVGLATYESVLGEAYLFSAEGYRFLNSEMLEYSIKALSGENGLRVNIDNNDRELQRAAFKLGFIPSTDKENTAMLDISSSLKYRLPEGFSFVSMADNWDYYK